MEGKKWIGVKGQSKKEASIDMAASYRPWNERHGMSNSCIRRLASARVKVHRLDRTIRMYGSLPWPVEPNVEVWRNTNQDAGVSLAELGSISRSNNL